MRLHYKAAAPLHYLTEARLPCSDVRYLINEGGIKLGELSEWVIEAGMIRRLGVL